MRKAVVFVLAALGLVVACLPNFERPQLEPDDYRYLAIARDLEQGLPGALLRSVVVENRWDHLWWVDVDGAIRFFRPPVSWSYWLDRRLLGPGPSGHLAANIAYHLIVVLEVGLLAGRWFGGLVPFAAAVVPFALLFCHGEVLWYVAGRTDTLAAVFFLATVLMHGARRSGWRRLAPLSFLIALTIKETALFLPVILLCTERLDDTPPQMGLRRWLPYVVAAGVWFGARTAVLAPIEDAGWVRPYFFDPLAADFPAHVGTALAAYLSNLSLAVPTDPFLTPEKVFARPLSLTGTVLGALLLAFLVAVLRRDRAGGPLFAWAALTLLPTLPAYVSERYLYLPSAALALGLAALAAKLRPRPWAAGLLLAGLSLWSAFQGFMLERKQTWIGAPPEGFRRWGVLTREMLGPWRRRVPAGKGLLLVNFPGDWITAQFLRDILRVQWDRPGLDVRILTPMPDGGDLGASVAIRRAGAARLLVRGEPAVRPRADGFPWLQLETGLRRVRPRAGLSVEVREARDGAATELLFEFDRPLDEFVVLRYVPAADPRLPERLRRERGSYRLEAL